MAQKRTTLFVQAAVCVVTLCSMGTCIPIPQPGRVQVVSSESCFNPCESILSGICGQNLKCENSGPCGYVCVPDCAMGSTDPACETKGQNAASTKDRVVVQINPVDSLDFGIFDVGPSSGSEGGAPAPNASTPSTTTDTPSATTTTQTPPAAVRDSSVSSALSPAGASRGLLQALDTGGGSSTGDVPIALPPGADSAEVVDAKLGADVTAVRGQTATDQGGGVGSSAGASSSSAPGSVPSGGGSGTDRAVVQTGSTGTGTGGAGSGTMSSTPAPETSPPSASDSTVNQEQPSTQTNPLSASGSSAASISDVLSAADRILQDSASSRQSVPSSSATGTGSGDSTSHIIGAMGKLQDIYNGAQPSGLDSSVPASGGQPAQTSASANDPTSSSILTTGNQESPNTPPVSSSSGSAGTPGADLGSNSNPGSQSAAGTAASGGSTSSSPDTSTSSTDTSASKSSPAGQGSAVAAASPAGHSVTTTTAGTPDPFLDALNTFQTLTKGGLNTESQALTRFISRVQHMEEGFQRLERLPSQLN